MYVYLVTSKLTYSRAVIVARSPEEAARCHPAGRTPEGAHIVSDGSGWKVAAFGGFPRAQTGWRPLRDGDDPCWPPSTDDVVVDLIGKVVSDIWEGVLCYHPDPEPRTDDFT